MSKEEQIKALKNGNGIQYLLEAAYKLLHNPIAMFDTDYNLKAYTDVSTDDPIWNELISTGTFSMKTQEFFANECFVEDVANSENALFLKSSKLKYDRIVGYVFNKELIKVANIVMVGCETPLEEDDAAALGILMDKITDEIRDDEYYTAFGRKYHEDRIIMLLEKTIREPEVYTGQIQILYDGFEDYLYVAVVDATHNDIQQNKLVHLKNLLESEYPFFKFAIYSGYIVMLISSKSDIFYYDHFFSRQKNLFEQNGLLVGISGSFENLYEIRKYYDQAVATLKSGIESKSGQYFFQS